MKTWTSALIGAGISVAIALILGFVATSPRARLNIVQVCSVVFLCFVAAKLVRRRSSDDPVSEPSASRLAWAGIIGAALAWLFTLPVYFIGDDFTHLGTSESLSWSTILETFITGENGTFLRPVGYLSIFLDHMIWGFDPIGYHITNLLIHFSSVLGSFFLLRELGLSKYRSLMAAGLFAAMPIQVEAVTWMGARFDLLALSLSLWSAVCYFVSRRSGNVVLYIASLFLFVLAVLSKESAYILPCLILAAEFLISRSINWRVAIYFALAALLAVYRWMVLGGVGGYSTNGQESFRDIKLKTLEGLLLRGPAQLLFGLNWSQPPNIVLILLCSLTIGSILLTAILCCRTSAQDRKFVLFGLAWMFLAMLPVHFLLLVRADINSSRVLYMPSIGMAIVLSQLVANVGPTFRRNALWIMLIVLFDLAVINNLRAWHWTGDLTKGVFPQIQERFPDPPPHTTFVIRNMPTTDRGVFFFDVGLNQMVQLGYDRNDVFAAHENELNLLPPEEQVNQILLTWDESSLRFLE